VCLKGQNLEIKLRSEGTMNLGGEGPTLMPSGFVWPYAQVNDERPPTLISPSRGVASLVWKRPGGEGAVGKLIGHIRAEILEPVGEPMHTSAVARELGRSPGNVADHEVLMTCGLVSRAHRPARDVRADAARRRAARGREPSLGVTTLRRRPSALSRKTPGRRLALVETLYSSAPGPIRRRANPLPTNGRPITLAGVVRRQESEDPRCAR
jgi:hypothetical protein